MGGPSSHVHLHHNSSPYNFFNLMMSEEFGSAIFQECTNMGTAMEGAGSMGDRDRTKYLEFTPFSREEIDSYIGLLLANGINMKPQINFWFLKTSDITIYGNDDVSKFFPRGRHRRDEFKRFFCMYDPRTDTKYDAATSYAP